MDGDESVSTVLPDAIHLAEIRWPAVDTRMPDGREAVVMTGVTADGAAVMLAFPVDLAVKIAYVLLGRDPYDSPPSLRSLPGKMIDRTSPF